MRPPTSVSGATGGAQGIKVRTPSDKVSRATTLHTPPDGMQHLTRLQCTMGGMDTSMIAPHSACAVGRESSPGCNPNFRR